MNPFQVGDIVYLKSGSEPMTIQALEGNNCRVAWHDSKGIEKLNSYPCQDLTKDNPKKSPLPKTGRLMR
ncbi:MAG TPA: DUF2158 domain-containing protein [Ignavibacteriaceae bacterium]|nr:DUF2158 domain-containing protein [Ignavibacteriaceae bacterium]